MKAPVPACRGSARTAVLHGTGRAAGALEPRRKPRRLLFWAASLGAALALAAACTRAGSELIATVPAGPAPAPVTQPVATPSPPPPPSTATPMPTLSSTVSPTPIPILHGPPYTVAIDPGHGGVDYAGTTYRDASGQVIAEKELTLAVALRLEALLRDAGYHTVLIRDGDYSLTPFDPQDVRASQRRELQARVDLANQAQADILVSIHFNGAEDRSLSGLEVYYNPERPFAEYSWALAASVHDSLAQAVFRYGYLELNDRGVRNDSEIGGDPANRHSYLLGTNPDFRPSLMPGIIVEPMFLSHEREGSIVVKPEAWQALARGLKAGIDAYFGWLQGRWAPE